MRGAFPETDPERAADVSDSQTDDSDFVTVAKVGAIAEGEGASFQVGDRLVAVFLHQGEYLAIDDLCPHMGASLGAGDLDEAGGGDLPLARLAVQRPRGHLVR